jgi:hypothetical protein
VPLSCYQQQQDSYNQCEVRSCAAEIKKCSCLFYFAKRHPAEIGYHRSQLTSPVCLDCSLEACFLNSVTPTRIITSQHLPTLSYNEVGLGISPMAVLPLIRVSLEINAFSILLAAFFLHYCSSRYACSPILFTFYRHHIQFI